MLCLLARDVFSALVEGNIMGALRHAGHSEILDMANEDAKVRLSSDTCFLCVSHTFTLQRAQREARSEAGLSVTVGDEVGSEEDSELAALRAQRHHVELTPQLVRSLFDDVGSGVLGALANVSSHELLQFAAEDEVSEPDALSSIWTSCACVVCRPALRECRRRPRIVSRRQRRSSVRAMFPPFGLSIPPPPR